MLRQTSSATERYALTALYHASLEWLILNTNWLSDAPIGQWHGVSTDDNGRVFALSLSGNHLNGEIPPELGNLANLDTLLLDLNPLRGRYGRSWATSPT